MRPKVLTQLYLRIGMGLLPIYVNPVAPARICARQIVQLRLFDGQISDFHSWAYIVRWAIKNIPLSARLCCYTATPLS